MKQVLQEHISGGGHNDITKNLLKSAFKNYFEQFDNNKIYLLKREVSPFLEASDGQLNLYIQQIQKEDYSVFEKMHQVVIAAIQRSKKDIPLLFQDRDHLFDEAKALYEKGKTAPHFNINYAENAVELLERQKNDAVDFLVAKMHRFQSEEILKHKNRFLRMFANSLEDHEERYLALDEGRPMSPEKREHTKSLLILKALTSSLDSHTHFLDDNEAYEMRLRLEKSYIGTGIIFEEGPEGIFVTNINPKSPAGNESTIHVGDRLLVIDDIPVIDQPYERAMNMLEKQQGTTTKLLLSRGPKDEKYAVSLKNEIVTSTDNRVDAQYEKYRHGIIGFLKLDSFYQGVDDVSSEQDLKASIEKLKEKGPLLGLIIDLRENGGGYLGQAVKVAGLFITDGIVVISKYGNGETHYYRDVDSNQIFDGPLIILTSRLTASAAEIVAQSLQDYGVALIVGDDRTYGKGSIQTQTVTEDGTDPNFKVTVGEYYTVSGKTPQMTGVLADVVVPGEYMFEQVGERYSGDKLKNDHIAPDFDDQLQDIPADKKTWYVKNYLPNLQKKTSSWQAMVPELKQRSAYRITHNAAYNQYIEAHSLKGDKRKEIAVEPPVKNIDVYQLQTQEARHIMHDMIDMEHKTD